MMASASSRSISARKTPPASRAGLRASPAVMQRIDLANPKAANAQILDDLMNGTSGETLVFQGAIGDFGYALPATGAAISARWTTSISMPVSPSPRSQPRGQGRAGLLATLVKARGLAPQR